MPMSHILSQRFLQISKDIFRVKTSLNEPKVHLQAAMDWLCAAQDADSSGGVSRSYALRFMKAHGRSGWLAPYPETTGYIIPTFFNYGKFIQDSSYITRAIRMAEWESNVQMSNGAVQGGVIGFPPSPTIFNTGQVLFGWSRAFQETGDKQFLDSALAGADFLVETQDSDGSWKKFGSQYARSGINVYDARTAWGLLEVFAISGNEVYREAGRKNLEFVLTQQYANGWFAQCCLDDNLHPLLHTIAYTMEGLLEGGIILKEKKFVEASRKTAESLLLRQRSDGSLAGRFDAAWNECGKWSCLTGDAQTAIVLFRLYEIYGEKKYYEAGKRLNAYLMGTQDITSSNTGIRGGIKGSFPIWEDYGTYEYLNWAAKFFVDAVLLEISHEGSRGK